jgi:FkbM family methyltransferase
MEQENQLRQGETRSDVPPVTAVAISIGGRSLSLLAREGTLDETIIAEVQQTYRIEELVAQCSSKPSVTIYDIGAHIGTFSAIMASLLPQAIVHAFEPAPENFAMLERNVRHLGLADRVRPRLAGLGARRGFVLTDAIHRSPDTRNTGGHSALGLQLVDAATSHGRPMAEMLVLGELLDNEERVDVLKIDCEGAEFEILYGLTPAQLAKIGFMLGEIHSCDGFAGSSTNGRAWNGTTLKAFLTEHLLTVTSSHHIDTDTAVLETFHATRHVPAQSGLGRLRRFFGGG